LEVLAAVCCDTDRDNNHNNTVEGRDTFVCSS